MALTRLISCCGEPLVAPPPPGEIDLAIRDDREVIATAGGEEILKNFAIDFALLDPVIVSLIPILTAFTKQSAGPGTYRVRLGGTYNAVDGTVLVTLVTNHGAYAVPPDFAIGGAFARPAGQQLLKLTGEPAVGQTASIQGYEISIVGA